MIFLLFCQLARIDSTRKKKDEGKEEVEKEGKEENGKKGRNKENLKKDFKGHCFGLAISSASSYF